MDKKITIPAGIALMVVLALAGMLAIFSYSPAPAHAALSDGMISQSGKTTTITFTTDAAVDDDAVIEVEFPKGFMVSEDLKQNHITVNKKTGSAIVKVSTDELDYNKNDSPLMFSVKVDADEPDARPAAGDVITIVIANDLITFPTGGAVAMDYKYGIKVSVGTEEVEFDYVVTIAEDSLDNLGGFFDTIPNKPNKSDEVVLEFRLPDDPKTESKDIQTVSIPAGSFITIVLHEDFQVPGDISESHVTIDGNVMAKPIGGAVIAVADARPADVTVDDDAVFDPGDNDSADWLIQIEVGDMAVGDAFPGQQGITEGSDVTVTIAKAAGIRAPLEAGNYYVAYALVEEPEISDLEKISVVTLNRLVTLSSPDGGRGDEIVATAKGISGGTADFWRDANANGERDRDENYLCRSVPINDNLAACTFTVTGAFDGGHGGQCNGSSEPPGPKSDCNIINVEDGEDNTATIHYKDDVFELMKSLSLSPGEGAPGDSITVQVRDWPIDQAVVAVTVAGADYAACGTAGMLESVGVTVRGTKNEPSDNTVTIGEFHYEKIGSGFIPGPACNQAVANGDAQVIIKIPNVTPGTKILTLYTANEDEDTDLVVGGSSVLSTPTRVVANQSISLTGNGFSAGGYIDTITLDGASFVVPPKGEDGNRVDSGGTWTLSVNIPVAEGVVDGGSQILIVTDNNKRTGSTILDVAVPTVSITPEEGRIDSTITISGENFPGLNDDGIRNIEVDVDYGDGADTDDAEPDADGRWRITMKVPNDVTIPSTNVVRVSFTTSTLKEGVIEEGTWETTFRHRVPRASVSLSPTSGPEGSMVTLTGTGFNRYRPLTTLDVGNIQVTVTPAPSTDRQGDLTFTFQIPGIESGTQNVVAKVGRTTASVGFVVRDTSGVVGAVTSEVAVALEPLLMAGTLDRVFYFNNMTKQWQWYIVDPAFAANNNLSQIVSGAPLWILVTESTTVTLNNRLVSFTCADGNCWNLITFP